MSPRPTIPPNDAKAARAGKVLCHIPTQVREFSVCLLVIKGYELLRIAFYDDCGVVYLCRRHDAYRAAYIAPVVQ